MKRVIRFYQKCWTDIVVEVPDNADEEEVFNAANDIYETGDYDSSDDGFENDGYADVTDEYKNNEISF